MSLYDKASLIMTPSGAKATKLYSHKPHNGNGDFTHDRNAGTATRVNKDGYIETVAADVPRLDYPLIDGVVQDCPALLLEPARTQLIEYSEDFSQTYWTKYGSSVTSGFISPDGGLNAYKLTKNGSGNSLVRLVSGLTNVSYTNSFYIKRVSGDGNIRIILPNGTDEVVNIDNEWKRYSVTSLPSGGSGAFIGLILSEINDEVLIYGAMLEQGSYPTSYIPNDGTTATVTRNADVCDSAGTSAEFNDSEGVLYWDGYIPNDGNEKIICLSTGTNNFNNVRFFARADGLSIRFQIIVSNQTEVIEVLPLSSDNYYKLAFKYKTNNSSGWVNGFKFFTDLQCEMPTGLSEILFDNDLGGTPFYGKTKELATFKTALTDSELEQLTSWDSFTEMAKSQEYSIR